MDTLISIVNKISTDDLIELLHMCEDRLGAISVKDFIKLTGKSKRAAYYSMDKKRVEIIGGIKHIIMNDHL